jgi:hypothetical protein
VPAHPRRFLARQQTEIHREIREKDLVIIDVRSVVQYW